MATYRFPLAKILEYRRMLYQRAVWHFAPVSEEWNRLEVERDQIKREAENSFRSQAVRPSVQDIYLRERYCHALSLKKIQNQRMKGVLKPRYLAHREKVLEAFQNMDFMEKLAKSSFDAYKGRIAKKGKNHLDDIALSRCIAKGDN